MIITRFKSYPYTDKNRSCTVTERTEMSHTKPEPDATKGIRTIVAEQRQQKVYKHVINVLEIIRLTEYKAVLTEPVERILVFSSPNVELDGLGM